MDFALSNEQTLLQQQMERAFADLSPLSRIRQHAALDHAFADDIWNGMSEVGIPGLLVEEQFGGLGSGLLDTALVAEILGRHAVPAPFFGPVVAAAVAIQCTGSQDQKRRLLPRIASGELRIALGLSSMLGGKRGRDGLSFNGGKLSGQASFVADVAGSRMVLTEDVSGGLHLVPLDATGLSVDPQETVDRTRSVAALTFNGVESIPLAGASSEAVSRLASAVRVVMAADLLGTATRMLEAAVEYAKTRVQFGKPIGSFQAVKHLCAEMAAQLEPGRALLWYAAHALDRDLPDAHLAALHAKAYLADAARITARNATEVHGGIGITDELGLHYWFKRVTWTGQAFGSSAYLRELAARQQGLDAVGAEVWQ